MSTIAPVTPFAGRTDLTTATEAELFIEYAFFADANGEYFEEGNQRTDKYGRREDSYAKAIKAHIWKRGYDAAYAAASSHPTIHSHDEAQAVADAAVGEMLELGNAWKYASKCATGYTIAGMAAKAAVSERTLKIVHSGRTMSNAGGNRHTDTQAMTEEEKKADLARRRILHADPQEYSFETAHSISGGGLHYEIDVDDALDQAAYGATTPVAALTQVITARTGQTEDEVRTWLHTFGITPETDARIAAVAQTDRNRAARIANGNRFPQADIAAIEGVSISTVERRLAKVRDAVWTDSELVGVLRSGLWTQKSIDAFTITVRETLDKENIEGLIAEKRKAAAHGAASETEEAAVWRGVHDDTFIGEHIRETVVDFVKSGVETSPLQYEVNEMTISTAIVSALTTYAGTSGVSLDRAAVENVPDQFFINYIADYLLTDPADVDPSLVAKVRTQVTEAVVA